MISSLFVLSMLIGVSGAILSRERYARFVSLLMAIIGLGLLYAFGYHLQNGETQQAIWTLLDYKRFRVDLNLSSNIRNYTTLLPFFIMTIISLLHTYFVAQEERRGRLSSFMLISLAFLMIPICNDNLLLLIVGCSLCGIVGIYIVNDFAGKKNYVFYTLVADMSLFASMGIIYSHTQSLDLSIIHNSISSYQHLELVTFLLLIGIAIKSGLFLFHQQIFSYSDLTYNRLLFLSYCVAPACGLILFLQTSSLFYASTISQHILLILSVGSMIYGLVGALLYDNLKEKSLSLNMLFWGFLYSQAILSKTSIIQSQWELLVLFYALNLLLSAISQSCSEEIYISRLGGLRRKLPLLLFIGILLSFAIIQRLIVNTDNYQNWILLGAIVIIISYLLRQIFFGISETDDKVWAFMKHPPLILILVLCVLPSTFIYLNNYYSWQLILCEAILLFLVVVYPLRSLQQIYEEDNIQLSNFFERLYEVVLLAPLNILGRVLWLTVDFLLIERTILSSISHVRNVLINLSGRMHSCRLIGYIFTTLLGLAIISIFGVLRS